jgi:exosortase K
MFIANAISRTGDPAERNMVRECSAPPERILRAMRNFYKRLVPKGRKLSHFLTHSNWKHWAKLLVVLLISVALKYFYSTASVNQLRWILAPVTLAVEFISGRQFAFEPHAGYIDSNHTFVIAASCAGVNFLITSFLMLALGKLWRDRSRNIRWSFLPIAAAVAYVATLVANTFRITTAMHLRQVTVGSSLTAGQLHRLEGIFVYFGFLLLLYVLSERANEKTFDQPPTEVANHTALLPTVRRSVFPLSIYYATTLGIPLLNGAFLQPGFWEHSIFVLATPLVFVIPLAGFVLFRGIRRTISALNSTPKVARAVETS